MIVQTAEPNNPHFVMTQVDHALASAELTQHFGNAQFAPLKPAEFLRFVVAHHDDGWIELDNQWLQDPSTGLPYNLVKTPLDKLVRTGKGSPDINEAHHPFCGIISSMHTYGLYHGRYGLSDFVFINVMPDELQPYVTDMLENELKRQAKLRQKVEAAWADEAFLFHNYKLLQFFDTLSLYFQTTHAAARAEVTFANVPRGVGDDVTLTIRPVRQAQGNPKSSAEYTLNPWPFAVDSFEFTTQGRYLNPQPAGTDLAPIANQTPLAKQTVTLTKA